MLLQITLSQALTLLEWKLNRPDVTEWTKLEIAKPVHIHVNLQFISCF